MPKFDEIGSSGLRQFMGFVEEAYHKDLRWPGVFPLYSRMRRSDPEISTVRQIYAALARGCSFEWELPDEPNDADKKAQEFAEQVMDDIDGGPADLLESMVSTVPFYGWGWWDAVPGVRDPDWKAPNDEWRSQYDDGRIGFRKLAWRDPSSFVGWEMDATGKMTGFKQYAYPLPQVTLPLSRSLHLTFGDPHNPEGLTPLETVWRLERIKYGLEIVQGIGFEHSAGYLNVTAERQLTDDDKANVKNAARAIMTAQEGNYAAWPAGVVGEVKDIGFQAAASLLEAIKYFGILKLTVYNMQWVALSATTGAGSYSAMQDSSSMFMLTFNAMLDGFAKQMDNQIGRRLFEMNAGAFSGMTRRPRLTITPIEKVVSLSELATLLGPIKATMPLGEEDFVAIRRLTGFLPETLPEVNAVPQPEPQPKGNGDGEDVQPQDDDNANPTPEDVNQAMTDFRAYAKEHNPKVYAILESEAE